MSLSTHTSPESFDRHAAEAAMAWYGWGSPVGLGIAWSVSASPPS